MSLGMPPPEPPIAQQPGLPPGPAPFATTTGLPPIDEMQKDANLVPYLTAKEQERIADTCCKDYDADVESRKPRMKRLAEYQGVYASVMKAKNFPWTDAANVNLPVLTYPWLQVQGRLYDMLWPANGKIFYSSPTNASDVTRANATEMFGNAYIRQRMPEMAQGLDDTLHQVCGYGSAFRRTYWNEYEERAASDWIPIADFVVMDTQRSQDPSMRDVPRYTLVQRLNRFDLEAWDERGIYENVEQIQWGEPDKPKETELEAKLKKIDGTTEEDDSSSTDDKPRMVIEQHRTWRLPDQQGQHKDMDGKAHAVIITIDYQSKKLLRVVVREEPDPSDHKRFQKQYQEHEAFTQAREAFESALNSPPQLLQGPMGLQEAPPPMPPPMPEWMKTDDEGNHLPPKPQRKREICFFTHYRAFPSEGFYGLGLGDFLIGLVKAINTLINQHIDGVTLRNAKGGFISKQMKGQRGKIAISPGQFVEVDAPMGSLKDGIAWLDPPQNDPTTMGLVELLMAAADKLVASSDLMSGQTSGANRTAKETQILAEQMMMQITVLARRMKEAQRHEIDKLWRIWGVFLPDEEIVSVIGEDGAPTPEFKISRSMFIPDAHVIPTADPRTKTQRIEDAMTVYAAVTSNPYLMQSPTAPQMMRAVTEDVLRAHGAERLLKMMPPPPQPPQPPQPAQPWDEDAGALQNKPHPVTPGDDDQAHLFGAGGHEAFKASPGYKNMSKEQKAQHDQHIRDHHAQMIRKTAQRSGMSGPPQMGPPQGPPQMPQQGAPQQ